MFNEIYYYNFSLPLKNSIINFDKKIGIISFSSLSINSFIFNWSNLINFYLYLFTSFIFKKIKFKGKGYYIYKNIRNTITPQFGYSHRIYIYSFFNKIRFLTKTKVLVFGILKSDVLKVASTIKNKRPINIFTGRGVRFSSEIVYKKVGKVSSYR